MPTVGSHQQAPFTTPLNQTSPVDANEVRLNDNAMQTTYNQHDADATIHVQSSLAALRPPASVEGRVWLATDTLRLSYDDGVTWGALTVGADEVSTGTLPIARGGTGVSSTPTNGQLLIGNGTGYTVASLTAGTNVTITAGAGSITIDAAAVSDARLKTAITPAADGTALLEAIRVVQHEWVAGAPRSVPVRFGVIAQELAAVLPEAVLPGDPGVTVETPWLVDLSALVPLLVQTLQTTLQRVTVLEQQVHTLTRGGVT